MAEAEDVIVDAARHATAYAQALLGRRRHAGTSLPVALPDVAPRLDLLLVAIHGRPWRLRIAQPPAPVTAVRRLFRGHERPWRLLAVPSVDGLDIWLPRVLMMPACLCRRALPCDGLATGAAIRRPKRLRTAVA